LVTIPDIRDAFPALVVEPRLILGFPPVGRPDENTFQPLKLRVRAAILSFTRLLLRMNRPEQAPTRS